MSQEDFRSIRKESLSIKSAKRVDGWRREWCTVNRQFGKANGTPPNFGGVLS